MDFYAAWNYLYNHRMFTASNLDRISYFKECLDIDIVKINPKTNEVDDDQKLNTKIEIWLECGKWLVNKDFPQGIPVHDIRLDCKAKTFEKAIIKLAKLVKKYYPKNSFSAAEETEYEKHVHNEIIEFEKNNPWISKKGAKRCLEKV